MKIILIYILLLSSINAFAFESDDVFDALIEDKNDASAKSDQDIESDLSELSNELSKSSNVKSAILRGLNKITARSYDFKVNIGSVARFGNLEILVQKCWQENLSDPKDALALLQIKEQLNSDYKNEVFYGWIFANSPALSSLEHPVYDITLVKCEK
jgi:hypothetical protein